MHGYGFAVTDEGGLYEGHFLHGRPSISGRWIYPDGDFYEGEIANGKASGLG